MSSPRLPTSARLASYDATKLKIGDFLILAGFLSRENFDGAVNLADKMRVPLGRVLSMHGYLDEHILQVSLDALAMIRSGKITIEDGLKAIRIVQSEGLSLEETLRKTRRRLTQHQPIADVLRKVNAITEKQKEVALELSVETSLPAAWVLLGQRSISAEFLEAALASYWCFTHECLNEALSLSFLRMARMQQIAFEQVLEREHALMPTLNAELLKCRLLLDSGLTTRAELLANREFALIQGVEVEQVLLDFGLLDRVAYDNFGKVYLEIMRGRPYDEAVMFIRALRVNNWNANDIDYDDPFQEEPPGVLELLKQTIAATREEVEECAQQAYTRREPLVKILLEQGYIDQLAVNAAEEIAALLAAGSFDKEKGIILLGYCNDTKCGVSQALDDFGWSTYSLNQAS